MFTYLTDTAPANELAVPLAPGRLREGTSGYITLDLGGTEAVTALHEWVLHAAATARGYGAVPGGETVHERYGSSRIRERFVPPYSIARVNADQQRSACTIAAEVLTGLGSAPVAGFEVCDIGERSERWDVLYRLDGSGRSPFPPEGEPTSEDRQA